MHVVSKMGRLERLFCIGSILICSILAAQDPALGEPSFRLDPDFVYLSGDKASLLSLKYYPSIRSEYERVFKNLQKGLENADEAIVLMNLSLALGEMNEFRKFASFALRKDSRKDEARLLLAIAALNDNQPEMARVFVEQIKDTNLDSGVANVLGLIAYQDKNGDKALQILREALSKDPANYALAMNLGLIMMEFQMYSLAEKHFSDVIKKHPSGYDAQLQYGVCLALGGKKAKAREIFESLKGVFSGNETINRAIGALNKVKGASAK